MFAFQKKVLRKNVLIPSDMCILDGITLTFHLDCQPWFYLTCSLMQFCSHFYSYFMDFLTSRYSEHPTVEDKFGCGLFRPSDPN